MSEYPAPGVAGDAGGRGPEALTPEGIETLLAEFRAWLLEAVRETNGLPDTVSEPEEALDLDSLFRHFIALRHEVNLQTRAVRAQQEQNAATLDRLDRALGLLQQSSSTPRAAGTDGDAEQVRPLLKALVDATDALGLARREVERVHDTILPVLEQLTAPAEPTPSPVVVVEAPRSLWQRLVGGERPSAQAAAPVTDKRCQEAEQAAGRVRQLVQSVVTGYTMSLQRLERTLQQSGLERIPCAGRPFDPELMEALEAVPDSGRPAGEVLDEVRPGYLWRGRVFRYAQVRVARA